MSEQKPTSYNEKIPAKAWPWIVGLLVGAIVYLSNKNAELTDKLVDATNGKAEMQREIADTWRELYYQSAKIVAYTNADSSRDFDSSASGPVKRTN